MNWDLYNKYLTINGNSQRERDINQLKHSILKNIPDNPSYKSVKLNGEDTYLVINTGTKPYYKEFESLPGQTVLCGDYVEWSNRIWLVYEADADDEIYIDGEMYECNYVQRWQNKNGELVERPSFVVNASAYNNGEIGNKTITLASNQFMVFMPLDEETIALRNGNRMFIDNNILEPSAYVLTRPDNVSMCFGEKGVTYYIFTQTERGQSDKLIELDNGEKVWIADYYSPTTPPSPSDPTDESAISSQIIGTQKLKIGYSKTYTVSFYDSGGNELSDVEFEWDITGDAAAKIIKTVGVNSITLKISDEKCLGTSFILSVIKGGEVSSQITVDIIGMV